MDANKLDSVEVRIAQIMSELKDFQRATVRFLFENLWASRDDHQHDRMLVADEVGLGKTLVAKGVIALLYREFLKKEATHFNVVYICSNQGIASQNLSKLTILEDDGSDNISATRLTMLVVRDRNEKAFLNLISLTPETSFKIVQGEGMLWERIVLYLILAERPDLSDYDDFLIRHLRRFVDKKNWQKHLAWGKENYPKRLDREIVQRFQAMLDADQEFMASFKALILEIDHDDIVDPAERNLFRLKMIRAIGHLRQILAQACVEGLQPDLVIMDEFQRFKELLPKTGPENQLNEISQLTQKLFSAPKLMILLLSATPYKLYATTQEVADGENHLDEFLQVLEFLCNDPNEYQCLKEKWRHYSNSLLDLSMGEFNEIKGNKVVVENLMRVLISRTERLIVSEGGDAMIDTKKAQKPLSVSKGEIDTYLAMDHVIKALQERNTVVSSATDYCKSAAYPLSFMEHYALKNEMRRQYKKDPNLISTFRKSRQAWLDPDVLRNYQTLSYPNTRLQTLMKEAFSGPTEKLLWIPPCMPCYTLSGDFIKVTDMSKILVFSCWEMVPRMISCLVSYEAERKTIGDPTYLLGGDEGKKVYFPSKNDESNVDTATAKKKRVTQRSPRPRLVFRALPKGINANSENVSGLESNSEDTHERGQMSLFSLLYPSITLAESFDVTKNLQNIRSLDEELASLAEYFQGLILDANLSKYCNASKNIDDAAWYWAAPIFLDMHFYLSEIRTWTGQRNPYIQGNRSDSAQQEHWDLVRRITANQVDLNLGYIPEDLPKKLALMALGSPAVLLYRSIQALAPDASVFLRLHAATKLADSFRDKFNLPESIAAIDLSIDEKVAYRERVIRYCAQGCLQSVLDEYMHMLRDSHGLQNHSGERRIKVILEKFDAALSLRSAQLQFESLSHFLGKVNRDYTMRVHFATCYRNMKSDNKSQMRADQVRDAFNSPFRPFVLATTSIGQEGLDFHYYCRKIMHWNLPHNPIDLEQREGRINRYKGLAIRAIAARRYSSETSFVKHGTEWDDLFAHTAAIEKKDRCDLIPFWHIEPREGEPCIERIVPYCPLSKEQAQLDWLVNVLAIYRISLGQARQEELVRFILNRVPKEKRKDMQQLLINLSPIVFMNSLPVCLTDGQPMDGTACDNQS